MTGVPAALLLAQAALLSRKKGQIRRAITLYSDAARYLEDCDTEPLCIHFLRQAIHLSSHCPPRMISPLFPGAECETDLRTGFAAVTDSVTHQLIRMLHACSASREATRLLLESMTVCTAQPPPRKYDVLQNHHYADAEFHQALIEDFRIVFNSSLSDDALNDLVLPFSFVRCVSFPCQRIEVAPDPAVSGTFSGDYPGLVYQVASFPYSIKPGAPSQAEIYISNPLAVPVLLSNIQLQMSNIHENSFDSKRIQVDVASQLNLNANESRVVPFTVVGTYPGEIVLSRVSYSFMGILPITEGLTLHSDMACGLDHPHAPFPIRIAEAAVLCLKVELLYSRESLLQGEHRRILANLANVGTEEINQILVLYDERSNVYLDSSDIDNYDPDLSGTASQTNQRNATLSARPIAIDKYNVSSSLRTGQSIQVPFLLYAPEDNTFKFQPSFLYRNSKDKSFKEVSESLTLPVEPLLGASALVKISYLGFPYSLEICLENSNSTYSAQLTDVSLLSPQQVMYPKEQQLHRSCLSMQRSRHILPLQVLKGALVAYSEHGVMRKSPGLHATEKEKHRPPIKSYYTHSLKTKRRSMFHASEAEVSIGWQTCSQARFGDCILRNNPLDASDSLSPAMATPASDIIIDKPSQEPVIVNPRQDGQFVIGPRGDCQRHYSRKDVMISIHCAENIRNDFSAGPLVIPASFTMQNLSPTRTVHVTLQFFPGSNVEFRIPTYLGPLTRHFLLDPLQAKTVKVKLFLPHFGQYKLAGWSAVVEVLDPQFEAHVFQCCDKYTVALEDDMERSVIVSPRELDT